MFLYTLMEATASGSANVGTKNKRGFYAALYAGMADRDLDMHLDRDKAVSELSKWLTAEAGPKLGEEFSHTLIKAFHEDVKLGLRSTFFTEAHLGYGWRVRNIWLGIDGFLLYEPRNTGLVFPTSVEFDQFRINIKNILVYGINANVGYYLTQSTALLLILGFEFGSQGDFTAKGSDAVNIIDGGIRTGVETKIDVTEKTSLIFGYQYCIISKSISSKTFPITKGVLYKHRVFGGIQYHFNNIKF